MIHGAVLDHVGVVGRDLAVLAVGYERLGFTLTPRALAGGGRIENRCVMLRQGYLDLMALAPGGHSATLERMLARHEGAHIIALGIEDEDATRARLALAGIDCPGVEQSTRPIDAVAPNGPMARFALLPVPEQPEARINLVHHLTPALLWQDRFLAHANHAVALDEVVLAVPSPADSAARFSRLAGRPVAPDPAGGYALDLARGTIRLLPAEAWETPAPVPSTVAVTLRTDDGNAAVLRCLADGAVAYRQQNDIVTVAAACAGGVAVRFRPSTAPPPVAPARHRQHRRAD
jgi:hypothetical protein